MLMLNSLSSNPSLRSTIGQAWIESAKIARKAGHLQTAYSCILQARTFDTPFAFIQSCKLQRKSNEEIKALHELSLAMQALRVPAQNVIDLDGEQPENDKRLAAKVSKVFC